MLYGGALLALGMSYIIGLILSMLSVPYPYQNSPNGPGLGMLPFVLLIIVGVMMVFVWFGMSGDDEEAMNAVRVK